MYTIYIYTIYTIYIYYIYYIYIYIYSIYIYIYVVAFSRYCKDFHPSGFLTKMTISFDISYVDGIGNCFSHINAEMRCKCFIIETEYLV